MYTVSYAQEVSVFYKEKRKAKYTRSVSYVNKKQLQKITNGEKNHALQFSSFSYTSVLRIKGRRSIHYPIDMITNDTAKVRSTYYDDIFDKKNMYTSIEVSEKNPKIYFMDLNTKNRILADTYKETSYIIKEPLQPYNWELKEGAKTINGYRCEKAIINHPHDEQELFLEGHNHFTTTEVWFTREIPISSGPAGYYGLPGLILELKEGVTHIVLDKIISGLDGFEIKAPENGIKISREDFEELPILEFMEN